MYLIGIGQLNALTLLLEAQNTIDTFMGGHRSHRDVFFSVGKIKELIKNICLFVVLYVLHVRLSYLLNSTFVLKPMLTNKCDKNKTQTNSIHFNLFLFDIYEIKF
jgi:hypothetical protein